MRRERLGINRGELSLDTAIPTALTTDQIDDLLFAGAHLSEIEDLIAATDLPEDEQAARWLRAWSALEAGLGRRAKLRRSAGARAL